MSNPFLSKDFVWDVDANDLKYPQEPVAIRDKFTGKIISPKDLMIHYQDDINITEMTTIKYRDISELFPTYKKQDINMTGLTTIKYRNID